MNASDTSPALAGGHRAQAELYTSSVSAPTRLYDAYIFDLDGTLYLGDTLLPGAHRLITQLRTWGKAVRFVSNNPTRDPAMYAEKLSRLGLPTPVEEIVTPLLTLPRWLLTHYPNAVVFPISEAPLIRALTDARIPLSSNPAEVDVVLASFDRTFTYEKLQIASDAIWFYKRARLVATNPDPYCPVAGGRGEPDAASVIAAIEAEICRNLRQFWSDYRLLNIFGEVGRPLARRGRAGAGETLRCLESGSVHLSGAVR